MLQNTILAVLVEGDVTGDVDVDKLYNVEFKEPRETLEQRMRKAVSEFLQTPEGRRIAVQDNGGSFDWGHALHFVPKSIWNAHGIRHIQELPPPLVLWADASDDLYTPTADDFPGALGHSDESASG